MVLHIPIQQKINLTIITVQVLLLSTNKTVVISGDIVLHGGSSYFEVLVTSKEALL